jgi:hypothetical protein
MGDEADANSTDWDISAVPGFNIPVSIVPSAGCDHTVVCSKDINDECPHEKMKMCVSSLTSALF